MAVKEKFNGTLMAVTRCGNNQHANDAIPRAWRDAGFAGDVDWKGEAGFAQSASEEEYWGRKGHNLSRNQIFQV